MKREYAPQEIEYHINNTEPHDILQKMDFVVSKLDNTMRYRGLADNSFYLDLYSKFGESQTVNINSNYQSPTEKIKMLLMVSLKAFRRGHKVALFGDFYDFRETMETFRRFKSELGMYWKLLFSRLMSNITFLSPDLMNDELAREIAPSDFVYVHCSRSTASDILEIVGNLLHVNLFYATISYYISATTFDTDELLEFTKQISYLDPEYEISSRAKDKIFKFGSQGKLNIQAKVTDKNFKYLATNFNKCRKKS